jgi:hypothetical protein
MQVGTCGCAIARVASQLDGYQTQL